MVYLQMTTIIFPSFLPFSSILFYFLCCVINAFLAPPQNNTANTKLTCTKIHETFDDDEILACVLVASFFSLYTYYWAITPIILTAQKKNKSLTKYNCFVQAQYFYHRKSTFNNLVIFFFLLSLKIKRVFSSLNVLTIISIKHTQNRIHEHILKNTFY